MRIQRKLKRRKIKDWRVRELWRTVNFLSEKEVEEEKMEEEKGERSKIRAKGRTMRKNGVRPL